MLHTHHGSTVPPSLANHPDFIAWQAQQAMHAAGTGPAGSPLAPTMAAPPQGAESWNPFHTPAKASPAPSTPFTTSEGGAPSPSPSLFGGVGNQATGGANLFPAGQHVLQQPLTAALPPAWNPPSPQVGFGGAPGATIPAGATMPATGAPPPNVDGTPQVFTGPRGTYTLRPPCSVCGYNANRSYYKYCSGCHTYFDGKGAGKGTNVVTPPHAHQVPPQAGPPHKPQAMPHVVPPPNAWNGQPAPAAWNAQQPSKGKGKGAFVPNDGKGGFTGPGLLQPAAEPAWTQRFAEEVSLYPSYVPRSFIVQFESAPYARCAPGMPVVNQWKHNTDMVKNYGDLIAKCDMYREAIWQMKSRAQTHLLQAIDHRKSLEPHIGNLMPPPNTTNITGNNARSIIEALAALPEGAMPSDVHQKILEAKRAADRCPTRPHETAGPLASTSASSSAPAAAAASAGGTAEPNDDFEYAEEGFYYEGNGGCDTYSDITGIDDEEQQEDVHFVGSASQATHKRLNSKTKVEGPSSGPVEFSLSSDDQGPPAAKKPKASPAAQSSSGQPRRKVKQNPTKKK